MTDLLKSNFTPARPVKSEDLAQDARSEFRKRALESISGSMVFVEDRMLWWDVADE